MISRNIQKRTPCKLKTLLNIKDINPCVLNGNIPLIAAILFGSNVLRPRALAPIMLHNNVSLGNKTRTKQRAAYFGLVFCRAFIKQFPRTFTFLTGSPTNSFIKQKHLKKKKKIQKPKQVVKNTFSNTLDLYSTLGICSLLQLVLLCITYLCSYKSIFKLEW